MRIRDVDLHVQVTGHGPPVLVMHGGLGLDHTYLEPFVSPLAARAELVFYDHRGNGRSPADLASATLDTWADDAEALCDALGHERVVVFGHSAGGFIALHHALRFPERVAGLILCGTSAALDHWELVHRELDRRGATAEQRRGFTGQPWTDDEDLAAWLQVILPVYFHRPRRETMALLSGRTIVSAEASRRFGACLESYDLRDRLGELRVPTLVVAGRHDFIMPPDATAAVLADGLPHGELVIFEESGHFPFAEEPDRFLATVDAWLASVPATADCWDPPAVLALEATR